MSLVWFPLGIPSGHNPPDIPRTIIEPVGADALIGPKSENRTGQSTHIRVDVGIDPYGFLRRFSKLGGVLFPHPSRLRRDAFS